MRDALKGAECKEIVRWTILAKSQDAEFETTKFGTDEQKRHMRLNSEDKQAHHCKVQKMFYRCLVDAAGIGGRKMLLPGEVFRSTSWIRRSQQRP